MDHGIHEVVPLKDAALVFALADKDGSGRVDYNEFAQTIWEADFRHLSGNHPSAMQFEDHVRQARPGRF